MSEQWVDIKGFEGLYQISTTGCVRSVERYSLNSLGYNRLLKSRIIKGCLSKHNLPIVTLMNNGRKHKLPIRHCMFISFELKGDPLKARNIDGDKLNNKLENIKAPDFGKWFCGVCGLEKPFSDFSTTNNKRTSSCYKCCSDYHKTKKGKAKKKISDKKYEMKNIDTERFYSRDKRNRKKFQNKHKDRLQVAIKEKYNNNDDFRIKKLAMNKLYRAIKSGKVTKPDRCSLCYCSKHKIYGVIRDFNKPLEVDFICSRCTGKMKRTNF